MSQVARPAQSKKRIGRTVFFTAPGRRPRARELGEPSTARYRAPRSRHRFPSQNQCWPDSGYEAAAGPLRYRGGTSRSTTFHARTVCRRGAYREASCPGHHRPGFAHPRASAIDHGGRRPDHRRRIVTSRERFTAVFGARPRARILLEARTEREWVARHVESRGHAVIVADPNIAPMSTHRSRRCLPIGRAARRRIRARPGP